jgi:ATP-dependent RNA helicase DDX49/DBP8
MSDSEAPVASTSAFVPPPQTSTWESLKVEPFLINALKAMACRAPTGVQAACIPPILAGASSLLLFSRNEGSYAALSLRTHPFPPQTGADCIGSAQTGSGKTIAFALPIMQALAKDPYGFFAIVLTPTRFVLSFLPLSSLLPCSPFSSPQ